MRKPQDWGQPCPNPDCSHYRLINRGNVSAIATYMTQNGKRRIFRCGACEQPFSETRDKGSGQIRAKIYAKLGPTGGKLRY